MKKANSKVDVYVSQAGPWQKEAQRLRRILLATELTEEWKWNKPCYTFEKSNLVMLCRLKDSCALGFMKGSLLGNAAGLLLKPGAESQSMRWMKFTSISEIAAKETIIKAHLQEAIAAEKSGLKVIFKQKHELTFPDEFHRKMKSDPALRTAFAALTPGRQRGYSFYFNAAKQAQTREARIDKCRALILRGKGYNEQ